MTQQSKAPPAPRQSRWLSPGIVGFITALLLAASFPSGAASLADQEFDAAVRSYRAGRTSEAFGQFQDLANRGDVDAARIALFLSAYGPLLYGKHWDVLPAQAAYWTQLVRNSGTSARAQPEFVPLAVGGKGKSAGAGRAAAVRTVSAPAQ